MNLVRALKARVVEKVINIKKKALDCVGLLVGSMPSKKRGQPTRCVVDSIFECLADKKTQIQQGSIAALNALVFMSS